MTTKHFSGTCTSTQEGLSKRVSLNNQVNMPWLGLGVFQVEDPQQCVACCRYAIEKGYRAIDTAALYNNEKAVGQAVRECGLPREDLFITSKVWNSDIRAGKVLQGFESSLSKLGLDYVDLYLLHWPIPAKNVEAWKVLEQLHQDGRIRAIGVSNYMEDHLQELIDHTDVIPAINQIEFHPYLRSSSLLEFCSRHDIRVEAWSPLMQAGVVFQDPVLQQIAKKHSKSVAQVILRWDLQTGVVTIPKSSKEARIVENASIFDFELDAQDMHAIDALDKGQRIGPEPHDIDF